MNLEKGYEGGKDLFDAVNAFQNFRNAPTVAEKVPHGVGMAGYVAGGAAKLLGGTMAFNTPVTLAGLGSAPAAGLMAGLGHLLGAGYFGYTVGTFADSQLGISDRMSATAKDDLDDEKILAGMIPSGHRGGPTDEERRAAAVRLPVLEAQRQGEIAALTRTATDEAPLQTGFMGDLSRGLLRGKHGIDIDAIEDEEARSPQALLAREAERQVELSNRLQIQAALGHWGE